MFELPPTLTPGRTPGGASFGDALFWAGALFAAANATSRATTRAPTGPRRRTGLGITASSLRVVSPHISPTVRREINSSVCSRLSLGRRKQVGSDYLVGLNA